MSKPGNLDPIKSFKGEYRFLSNYWPAKVSYEGVEYPSVEQAYKAAKTLDNTARLEIKKLTPNKKGLNDEIEAILSKGGIRHDWTNEMRLSVMEDLLVQKFDGRDKEIQDGLLKTGDRELVEGNDWGDIFFGVCEGVGENHLGKLLMKVRDRLMSSFILKV